MNYKVFKSTKSVMGKLKKCIFRPIVKAYVDSVTTEFAYEKLYEAIFHAKGRDIIRYKAAHEFRIPGLYWETPNIRIEGNGKRKVKVGDKVLVRMDVAMPNRIDVQRDVDNGDNFSLTKAQWNSIKRKLEVAE